MRLILVVTLASISTAAAAQDLGQQTSQQASSPMTAWAAPMAPQMKRDLVAPAPVVSCAAVTGKTVEKGESLSFAANPAQCAPQEPPAASLSAARQTNSDTKKGEVTTPPSSSKK